MLRLKSVQMCIRDRRYTRQVSCLLKVLGILLLIAAGTIAGYVQSHRLSQRVQQLEEMLRFLNAAQTEIRYSAASVAEIVQRHGRSLAFLQECAAHCEEGEDFHTCLLYTSVLQYNGPSLIISIRPLHFLILRAILQVNSYKSPHEFLKEILKWDKKKPVNVQGRDEMEHPFLYADDNKRCLLYTSRRL